MKFTLAWLKDHLDTDATLVEITDKLTAIGLELEGVEDRAADLAPFTVGYVIEAKQHPNADRLRVCIVDTGAEHIQVVCGAPNARTGMKGVFAPSGTTIPGNGMLLKPTSIRGEESNGMLCSEREMGMSDEHDGIIDLPEDTAIGTPFAEVMGLDDPVIDINVTPNKQDCLGVRGIARDLAAAGMGTLKPLDATAVTGTYDSPINVELNLASGYEAACSCFLGRHFRGLTNGASPDWLQRRLTAIGLRSISALVDMTNYITYDLGRPLHVFDAGKVTGNIQARMATAGETFQALDGKEYELDGEITVIADQNAAEAIGGVMGGEASGCTDETTEMFLEAALFDAHRTAATGRRLGIESDARYRFERGVDPAMVQPGVEIATRMILDMCGGETSHTVMAGTPVGPAKVVGFRPARVTELIGIDVDEAEQRKILSDLGFGIADGVDNWQVTAPTWRTDIDGEADIVEEVARIAGYDRIVSTPLPRLSVTSKPALTPAQRRRPTAKRALASRGMMECVTWSFMPRRFAELFGGGDEAMLLTNPISSELDAMRPSMLGNLILAVGRNVDRGFEDVSLFEVGPQFRDTTPKGQDFVAAGLRRGRNARRHWDQTPRAVDAYDAKADALAVLEAIGAPTASIQIATEAPAWYHPGRSGVLRLGPKNVLAAFGEVHPRILDRMDVTGPMVAFEVFIDNAPLPKAKATRNRAELLVSDLQSVQRDFAFVVDQATTAAAIVRAAKGADKAFIGEVNVFDIYDGKGIEDGKKSVAITARLEPKDATLTDPVIEAIAAKIVAAVSKATGGTLRG
ncbi:MAG: phenylalanine--tRNA ligase subunit beta [Alphaproteobacteria bacterium]|nr:phenylalanine--tRNA ligase subunit beta [Alphaproteobacteria bacterium]